MFMAVFTFMYSCFFFQLETLLKRERGDVSVDEVGNQSLVQQNIELRRKLEEEHTSYKRKLQQYQDGQARQGSACSEVAGKSEAQGFRPVYNSDFFIFTT